MSDEPGLHPASHWRSEHRSHIATISRGEPGFWDIRTKDGKLLTARATDVDSAIVEMLPGNDCGLLGFNTDSKARPRTWYDEPIITFARTVLGDVRPITLGKLRPEPSEIRAPYTLCRKGSALVCVTDGTSWDSHDAWLEDKQARFDAEQAERAAEREPVP